MGLKFLGQQSGSLPSIDRYELIAEIASGGMATVYLARVVGVGGFQRMFAIKRLHPHLGSDTEFVSMFLDEARIVAGIRHPNVVPVLEVGATDRGYYLVMEYIEGDTLAGLASRAMDSGMPIPTSVAIRICLDTLAGLHAAHEHVDSQGNPYGLVHRDVSPQNILLDTNGVAKIADFGVARAATRLTSTRAGQLKGKVAYMAPEQAQGEQVTRQADLFSAGVVLWEALANKRLFVADNDAAILNRLMFEPIPDLLEQSPHLPQSVAQVVHRALQRDRQHRFATATEFANALRDAARVNNVLGIQDDVKNYMDVILGDDMNARRTEIRTFLATVQGPGDPSLGVSAPSGQVGAFGVHTGSSLSGAAMTVPTDLSEPSSSYRTAGHVRETVDPYAHALAKSKSRKNKFVAISAGAIATVALGIFGWTQLRSENQTPSSPAAGGSLLPPVASTEELTNELGAHDAAEDSVVMALDEQQSAAPDNSPPPPAVPKRPVARPKPKPTTVVPTSAPTQSTPPPSDPGADDLKSNPYR